MNVSRLRFSAVVGALALAGAGVVAAAPAVALTKSTTVNFLDCDVREVDDEPSSRIGSKFSWSPRITLTHPSPVRTSSDQRMGFTISDFPAGKLPAAPIAEGNIHIQLGFEHADASVSTLHQSWRWNWAAPGKILPGEGEDTVTAPIDSEFQTWAPLTLQIWFDGYDLTDEYVDYYVQCEPIVSPKPMLTVAVVNPGAAAQVALDREAVKQGGSLKFTARDFAPGEKVKAYIGTKRAATFRADQIGAVAGRLKASPTAKKGTQSVRLVGSSKGETAKAPLKVKLVKPTAKLAKKSIKRGKKVKLTAKKFAPNEKVRVTFKVSKAKSKGSKSFKVTLRASSKGKISKKIRVPKKTAKGTYKVKLKGMSSTRYPKTLKIKIT